VDEVTDEVVKLNSDRVRWRASHEEVVVLDLARSEYMAINKTGSALWPLLVAGTTRAHLCETLIGTFGVSAQRAESDVTAFLGIFSERGMLDQEPGQGAVTAPSTEEPGRTEGGP